MSILIKGMEMPKRCLDCPCFDLEYAECQAKVTATRENGCPLVEVPEPHGRLIDADEYQKKICTYNETGCGSCEYQTKCPADAPTVIEAEGDDVNITD